MKGKQFITVRVSVGEREGDGGRELHYVFCTCKLTVELWNQPPGPCVLSRAF